MIDEIWNDIIWTVDKNGWKWWDYKDIGFPIFLYRLFVPVYFSAIWSVFFTDHIGGIHDVLQKVSK